MNKVMMPQRSFSPRSFMGDRGIRMDTFGRVIRSDSICVLDANSDYDRILAPRPRKPCPTSASSSPVPTSTPALAVTPSLTAISPLFRSHSLPQIQNTDSPKLDEWEASREIQTIILQSFNEDLSASPVVPRARSRGFMQPLSLTPSEPIPLNSSYPFPPHIALEDSLDMQFPEVTTSPSPSPFTPPIRSHNPISMNSAFENDSTIPQGAELGLLSVSPPPTHRIIY
eukprot:TRINITY_DN7562_c0_g2_i2.p1 TRINITY_DN7562_c0_g2~~TRINITY_DN7562_c0_g2_i2.p1  ORF type:complete len:227 (-),score=20.18 TRINITY_DN7562_c0_g2_i2:350-1030(-)